MKLLDRQRGSILLIAIVLIVGVSLLAVAFTALQVGDTASSADHAVSAQALYVAEAGLSNALENYRSGTACGAIALNNVAFGNGSFTATGFLHQPAATTLTAAINATATTIPVVSTAGYSPHGRITINAEQIDYTGITATSFTGAKRGVNGTTAAAQPNGSAVTQNLCRIRSTGIVGAGQRILETTAAPAGGATQSNFLDTGVSGFITTANNPRYILGSLASPTFTAGTNVLIAAIAFENTILTRYDVVPPPPTNINPPIPYLASGWLRLRRGNTQFASNSYQINVGGKQGSPAPSAQSFTRQVAFLLGRDAAAPANPTYYVDARASTNSAIDGRITGEVKMVVINNPPSSFLRLSPSVTVPVGGVNMINNQPFTGPAGDRVLIAAVQVINNNNTPNLIRTIPAGALQLRKGNQSGPILAQNEFAIDIMSERTGGPVQQRVYAANRSTSILLVARDPSSGNNQRYTLRISANPAGNVLARGQVMTIGMNATVTGAVVDGGSVAVGTAETVIANLATTLGAGQHVVIAGIQYANGAGDRSVGAGGERLAENGITQSSSQYGLSLCSSATSAVCDDFASGLLWRNAAGSANPTFSVRALANSPGLNAEAKILALQIQSGISLIDWVEVFQ